jgi:hypothetical protein
LKVVLKVPEPVCNAPRAQALLPSALDMTLTALGDGPKAAILATLQQKYGLDAKGPAIDKDKLSASILEMFGHEGGQMLLQKLWLNLEAISGQKLSHPAPALKSRDKVVHRKRISAEEFNGEVSKVISDFILEALGPESFSWLEIRLREHNTSLKWCYFDADKISPILWSSFNTASDFILNRMMTRLCTKMGSKPVKYSSDSKLSAILDNLYGQMSQATDSTRTSAA